MDPKLLTPILMGALIIFVVYLIDTFGSGSHNVGIPLLADLINHENQTFYYGLIWGVSCLGGKGRACPPCPDEPWVVLADVTLSDGQVTDVKCFEHRRYAASAAMFYFQCGTASGTSGLGALSWLKGTYAVGSVSSRSSRYLASLTTPMIWTGAPSLS